MKIKVFLTLMIYLSLGMSLQASAQQLEAFKVTILDRKILVISPRKYHPHITLIIENKTLVNQLAKIITKERRVLKYLTLKSGGFLSVNIHPKKGERLFFFPISPGLQKVELKIGSAPYEIPPKR